MRKGRNINRDRGSSALVQRAPHVNGEFLLRLLEFCGAGRDLRRGWEVQRERDELLVSCAIARGKIAREGQRDEILPVSTRLSSPGALAVVSLSTCEQSMNDRIKAL